MIERRRHEDGSYSFRPIGEFAEELGKYSRHYSFLCNHLVITWWRIVEPYMLKSPWFRVIAWLDRQGGRHYWVCGVHVGRRIQITIQVPLRKVREPQNNQHQED